MEITPYLDLSVISRPNRIYVYYSINKPIIQTKHDKSINLLKKT